MWDPDFLVLNQEPESLSLSANAPGNKSSTPEFDFWMTGNLLFPEPDLFPADQLFVDGVLLPLDLIPAKQPDPIPTPDPEPPGPDPEPEFHHPDSDSGHDPSLMSDPVPALSASKRCREIFAKNKRNSGTEKTRAEKEKRIYLPIVANQAELNINIWPFSRSRSVGSSMTRPGLGGSKMSRSLGSSMTRTEFGKSKMTRKASSAPCSRSNSPGDGESKPRIKSPSSPSRAGVHLGRSSSVRQARRGVSGSALKKDLNQGGEKGHAAGGGKKLEVKDRRRNKSFGAGDYKGRVLNINVPMCMGYRQNLCVTRGHENGGGRGKATAVGGGGGLFSGLFCKHESPSNPMSCLSLH